MDEAIEAIKAMGITQDEGQIREVRMIMWRVRIMYNLFRFITATVSSTISSQLSPTPMGNIDIKGGFRYHYKESLHPPFCYGH